MNAYQSARSIPGLPVWTFDPALTGTPSAGFFQTDNSNPSSVANIFISKTQKGGLDFWDSLFGNVPSGTALLFTNRSGKTYNFVTSSEFSNSAGVLHASGSMVGVDSNALSGDYQLSFMPGLAAVPATPTIQQVLAASGITPAPDGTVTPVTSITTSSGIPTAIS